MMHGQKNIKIMGSMCVCVYVSPLSSKNYCKNFYVIEVGGVIIRFVHMAC
jgi:hypothetical protein